MLSLLSRAKVVPALPRQILIWSSKTVMSSQAGKLCWTSRNNLSWLPPGTFGPNQPPLRNFTSTRCELMTFNLASTVMAPMAPNGPRKRRKLQPRLRSGSRAWRFSSQGVWRSQGWLELLQRKSQTPFKREHSRVKSAGCASSRPEIRSSRLGSFGLILSSDINKSRSLFIETKQLLIEHTILTNQIKLEMIQGMQNPLMRIPWISWRTT